MWEHHVQFGREVIMNNFTLLLSMGAVFAIFAGFIHWWPLFTGYVMNLYLTIAHFWLMFIGVKVTFFPQHFLGLKGMPRRYLDYLDIYWTWNVISRFGALMSIVGVWVFFYIIFESIFVERQVIRIATPISQNEWIRDAWPISQHSKTTQYFITIEGR